MTPAQRKKLSKFLSLVLRHQPEVVSVQLDENGWVAVDDLLNGISQKNRTITREQLEEVVRTNDKQRFSFDHTGERIRANQGHSVEVELGHPDATPPEFLIHGTSSDAVESILQTGLDRRQRHAVHLHEDVGVATQVGGRHGKPVLLRIHSGRMHQCGFRFACTPNSVWLTESVPPEYIEVIDSATEVRTEPILFYSTKDPFGEFSNFSAWPIKIDGKVWPTTEHYFQAQKFAGHPDEEELRKMKSPMIAARAGRSRRRPFRKDWNAVRLDVMRTALRAKFTQHDELRSLLLSTGTRKLIEHTTNDSYWGDAGDGSGENWLGRLLMELRESLQSESM